MLTAEYANTFALHAGLLLVRLIIGLGIAAHGAQKLFGSFGGYGLSGTGGFMESLGFRPGRTFAFAAGMAEFLGGLLLAMGLLGPVGPALIVSAMLVAIGTVHRGRGFFATNNGWELPLLFAAGAVAFAFTGHGRFSADAAFGIQAVWTPFLTVLILGLGVVAAVVNLLVLRKEPVEAGSR